MDINPFIMDNMNGRLARKLLIDAQNLYLMPHFDQFSCDILQVTGNPATGLWYRIFWGYIENFQL